MREDLKTYYEFAVIEAATTPSKISEKLHLCMVRWGNLRSLSSSRIRPLLTKVAIGSCYTDQDQIAERGYCWWIAIETIG
jgi:hypothetical protein